MLHCSNSSARIHKFGRVCGELVECEPDGLRGSRRQAQLGVVHGDTRTSKAGEVRELSVNKVLDLDAVPVAPDEQVLTG